MSGEMFVKMISVVELLVALTTVQIHNGVLGVDVVSLASMYDQSRTSLILLTAQVAGVHRSHLARVFLLMSLKCILVRR
jgi:hypothetical protein